MYGFFILILYICNIKFSDMTDIRTGNGYDVHALAEGLPLFLGGVRIDSPVGCIAHSDGDVAIHALCDALLGALALGDIGKHFPDSSDEFKGMDSKILLHRTMDLITGQGYHICNADITIAMQRPKLAPYIMQMRQTLAEVMGIDTGRISVKATTTEKLGFVGRGEGCEVYATVLVAQ
jgi:2-C-methyl-D-erythritol 2,4-cyclodiphosphate synthase